MRSVSPTFVGGAVMFVLGVGLAAGVRAGTGDERRPSGPVISSPHRRRPYGFDIQVLVGGRPLPQATADGGRRVEAVVGMEYELRLTNPTPDRVAVAVSVDGLNVIDARHTNPWDASKWVIHPHGTLTLSGWQVGSERARRFYFTSERDAYATRIGRPGEFGVISAVFYRERHHVAEIIPHRTAMPERGDTAGPAAEAPALGTAAHSAPRIDNGSARRRLHPGWPYPDGRAATGIGSSVRSEVREVGMELERDPVAVVTLRYEFRLVVPRPLVVPGSAPEPPRERGGMTRPDEGRFAPEP
jgi:hypothetical protein